MLTAVGIAGGDELDCDCLALDVDDRAVFAMPDLFVVLKKTVKHAADFAGAMMRQVIGLDRHCRIGEKTRHDRIEKLVIDVTEITVLDKGLKLAGG